MPLRSEKIASSFPFLPPNLIEPLNSRSPLSLLVPATPDQYLAGPCSLVLFRLGDRPFVTVGYFTPPPLRSRFPHPNSLKQFFPPNSFRPGFLLCPSPITRSKKTHGPLPFERFYEPSPPSLSLLERTGLCRLPSPWVPFNFFKIIRPSALDSPLCSTAGPLFVYFIYATISLVPFSPCVFGGPNLFSRIFTLLPPPPFFSFFVCGVLRVSQSFR